MLCLGLPSGCRNMRRVDAVFGVAINAHHVPVNNNVRGCSLGSSNSLSYWGQAQCTFNHERGTKTATSVRLLVLRQIDAMDLLGIHDGLTTNSWCCLHPYKGLLQDQPKLVSSDVRVSWNGVVPKSMFLFPYWIPFGEFPGERFPRTIGFLWFPSRDHLMMFGPGCSTKGDMTGGWATHNTDLHASLCWARPLCWCIWNLLGASAGRWRSPARTLVGDVQAIQGWVAIIQQLNHFEDSETSCTWPIFRTSSWDDDRRRRHFPDVASNSSNGGASCQRFRRFQQTVGFAQASQTEARKSPILQAIPKWKSLDLMFGRKPLAVHCDGLWKWQIGANGLSFDK